MQEHDIVRVTIDLPKCAVKAGTVGVILLIHENGEAFEVEIANPHQVITVTKAQVERV